MTHRSPLSFRVCRLVILLALLPGVSAAMTNDDLLNLKMNGLLDETILLLMEKQPGQYDTSPNALIKLKNGGLSDAVIQKVIALAHSPQIAETPQIPETPEPAEEAVVRPVEPVATPPPPSEPAENAPAAASTVAAPAPPPPASPSDDEVVVEVVTLTDTDASPPAYGDPNLVIGVDAAPATEVLAPPAYPVPGHTYFTRVTLRQEKDRHATTNYGVGDLVPINTPVHLLSMKRNDLVLRRLDTGERLHVENIEKHTERSLEEMAGLLLASRRTPVEQLPRAIATAIRRGTVVAGMTKEEVLMARGYPPAHATPSLAEDRWVYWESRRRNAPVVFNDGVVVIAGTAAE